MSKLHSPLNERHTRLFELLRQQENAEKTEFRLRGMTFRKATPEELDQIKLTAARSMGRIQ